MSAMICYVAGKSGGHIIPALTHAQQVKSQQPDLKVLFFSTDSPLDRSLLEHNKLIDIYQPLTLANVPRKNLLAWPTFLLQLIKVVWISFRLLHRHKPSKVVSMGGYISVPVCLVAKMLGIPIELYELNVVPGAAVNLLSRWATVTHCCFAQTKAYLSPSARCGFTPYPLRYTERDRCGRDEACAGLGIDTKKTVICILGGSQGSRFINDLVKQWVSHNLKARSDVAIIHQTGAQDIEQMQQFYQQQDLQALVFAYRHDIHLCYAAADVILARAGAGTLFEILFFKRPAIIIPLESKTTDHQRDNAFAMQADHPDLFKVLVQADVEKAPEICFAMLGRFCQNR